MQNRVGQQFGNYRLLHLLGRGGFAEVYLGEHVYMQSKAAVKVLYGPLATSEAQRFLHEAQTLVRLEHTNIVGIKEFDIKEDIPFLVMHYASNGTLHRRHPRGQRVPLETIVPYVQQVASALQYAHDRQIVHRDVKPENMLIDNKGNILLSDFGIAVLSSSSHSHSSNGQAGTYLYMAPEQISGKALPASDQYALGITVYEWLCGEAPFLGSAAEITAKHLHALPPSFHERGIAIDPQVEMVIRHALEKVPQQRFASVREFALALQSSSNAQQHKSVQYPVPSRNDSILPSPSPKTPGFTYPTAPPPPVPPRLTPHVTRSVEPPTSAIPSSPIAPTIYPGNVPYAPTQPAPPSVQPRKTGSPCLVTTVISVVLLLLIGSGMIFVLISYSSSLRYTVNTGNTPFVPANITVSPSTLQAINGSANADCSYLDLSFGPDSGWDCPIRLHNNGQNKVNWRATSPADKQVKLQTMGSIEVGESSDLTIHVPLKDCPGSVDITITPEDGTPQKVTWTCSFSTGNTPVVPANITVSPPTLQAINGRANADCFYLGLSFGPDSGWNCPIRLYNNGQNKIQWHATVPTDKQVEVQSTGSIEAGESSKLNIHVPLKDCPGSVDITIIPEGGTAQKVTWICS